MGVWGYGSVGVVRTPIPPYLHTPIPPYSPVSRTPSVISFESARMSGAYIA